MILPSTHLKSNWDPKYFPLILSGKHQKKFSLANIHPTHFHKQNLKPYSTSFWAHKVVSFIFLIYLFILFNFLFLAVLGLHCCTRAFSSCGERGLLFIAVHGLLMVGASRCRARALGAQASVVVSCGLSSCGLRALELRLSSCGSRA